MYMPDTYIYCIFIEYTVSLLVPAVSNKLFLFLTCVVVFVMLNQYCNENEIYFLAGVFGLLYIGVREVILTHSL